MELYKRSQETSSTAGLYLMKKLKLEHVRLSSFSRMRVDLATQVLLLPGQFPSRVNIYNAQQTLSDSVANGL